MTDRTYRCLDCLEETVDRGYSVSHLRLTCGNCGEFSRFVQEGVYQQFQTFEESPPEGLEWDRLGRMEKFLVAEKMVRKGKTVEDFEIEVHEGEDGEPEAVAADGDGTEVEAEATEADAEPVNTDAESTGADGSDAAD